MTLYMKRIRVQHPKDGKVSKTVLAEAIMDIGKAAKKLHDSGLNEDAVITLLADKTRLGKRDIKTVLDGLRQLESWYCR